MVTAHVLDGPLGQDLRVVAQVLVLGVALVEVVVAELPELGEVLQHAPVVAEELVPARLGGAVVRQPAAVPLADQGRRVTGLLEQRGQGRVVRVQPLRPVRDRLREPALRTARIAPGVQAEPGRRAGRRPRVGVREAHALPGQPVQVRRPDVRGAVGGEVRPAEVVAEDDQEIGTLSGRGGGTRLERTLGRGGFGCFGGRGGTGDGGHGTATHETTEGAAGYFRHGGSLQR